MLIPPNISDPLNLNAEDDSDYEAKLISPLIKKKKVIFKYFFLQFNLPNYEGETQEKAQETSADRGSC